MPSMRPRALVVEDDLTTRNFLRRLAEGEGFHVDTAVDGEAALALIGRVEYTVLLVDLVLPKISGAQVLEHLQGTSPKLLEKVIVVTGIPVDEVRGLFPTIMHAMSKPILPAKLRTLLRRWLPDRDEGNGSGFGAA